MKKKQYILLLFALLSFAGLSCDDFLSELPDNRTDVDSPEKARKLLVSAYPGIDYIVCTELSSDNVDDYGDDNPNGSRFWEELYQWRDVTETDNESPAQIWSACYSAIASANQVLQSIAAMGDTEDMRASKGEALICRAYAHFILTNVFCQHYHPTLSETDLGIPYMEKPETELNPKYERPTVAFDYEKMAADIEAGLPLINDSQYDVPKYHFNRSAAHAFAARFYLYYQQWDKAIEYAGIVLGAAPQTLLRDNASLDTLPKDPLNLASTAYISETEKANLLLITAYSSLGYIYGAYYTCSRYSHGAVISTYETLQSRGPWGAFSANTFRLPPWVYRGTNLDKILLPRLPRLFEYTDPVAGIGYSRTVYAAFTVEEALLNRAEAYIMKKDYAKAMADIKLWVNNTVATGANLVTEATIDTWAKNFNYYEPEKPTPKKRLAPPGFTIDDEKQENFLHFLLYIRRHETMHMGLRWFDVKRYGITVTRRVIQSNTPTATNNVLKVRDPRCAIQIPADVVSAGLTPNPR
ncbi:MAG: RagB/SusD family nutrient uptake outer membrane protein [Prevotellaceae bacterium]|jgi:tetratricopeptide (TPR) repeat protein|nr:RagB/SusD family nutrient uptake outer membrane protein [Prevotellaceae bacterium]